MAPAAATGIGTTSREPWLSGCIAVSARDFAGVYDEHVWRVYGFLAYRVRDRYAAEDVTQATFDRPLRAWPRFARRRSSESTWLLAVARNLLIDHHRREERATALPELAEARGAARPADRGRPPAHRRRGR